VPDPDYAGLLDETPDDSPLYAPSRAVAWLQDRPPARRVIDVAKEALCLMCEALHGLGDRHAVYGFSGQGRHEVEFHIAKEFHEPWSDRCARAIAAMQPRRYTRTGAALRHATRRLAREAARTRVLIVITDGYPQDVDYGPEPTRHDYGVHDTAQALREARRAGISTFCISINHADHDYLRQMCAPDRYLVLEDIGELPAQLGKVYRSLTAGL
jgi:nitric oxide reductase NorD protein